MLIPTLMTHDNSQMTLIQKESPNKVLHNIVSHSVEENKLLEIEAPGQHLTLMDSEDNDDILALIAKDADLSPSVKHKR